MSLALQERVRAPKTAIVTSLDDLKRWILENGLPAVLKVDGSHGGAGTEIVYSVEEAESAFRKLNTLEVLMSGLQNEP